MKEKPHYKVTVTIWSDQDCSFCKDASDLINLAHACENGDGIGMTKVTSVLVKHPELDSDFPKEGFPWVDYDES